MDVQGVTPHPFVMTACVPDEMVSLDADGGQGAWSGVALWPGTEAGGRRPSVVLVCIDVTPFSLAPEPTAGERLRAALRDRNPAGPLTAEEFRTADGNLAARVKGAVTQQLNGREVTTGQVQVLVVFPGAAALGVVSAVCPDPADLDRAAALVSEIAAQLSVTATSAAA
jgi:hypothetical protein